MASRAVPRATVRLGCRQRQDRAQLRADAGCPAKGKGQPQNIGPEGRSAPCRRLRSAPRGPETGSGTRRGNAPRTSSPPRPRSARTSSWFCRNNAPKAEAVKPSRMKIVDRPSTKNSAASNRLAPRRLRRAFHLVQADAAHVGQIGRHNGQHAGRQEADMIPAVSATIIAGKSPASMMSIPNISRPLRHSAPGVTPLSCRTWSHLCGQDVTSRLSGAYERYHRTSRRHRIAVPPARAEGAQTVEIPACGRGSGAARR